MSLYAHFGERFYHEWMLNFVKCFIWVYWDDHVVLSFHLWMWYFTLTCIHWTILATMEWIFSDSSQSQPQVSLGTLTSPWLFVFMSPWVFLFLRTLFWGQPKSVSLELQFVRAQINSSCLQLLALFFGWYHFHLASPSVSTLFSDSTPNSPFHKTFLLHRAIWSFFFTYCPSCTHKEYLSTARGQSRCYKYNIFFSYKDSATSF